MSPSSKLSSFNSTSIEDPTLYRSVVGSLQYLLATSLDLAFFINQVCQFMHAPCVTHWQAVKHILRYLKHTIEHGLTITSSPSYAFVAFSDVDWTRCPDDHKSTDGYYVFYGKQSLGTLRNSPQLLHIVPKLSIKPWPMLH